MDNVADAKEIIKIASKIELVIFDVDGVLTNAQLFYFPEGEYKAFNSRDGLGFRLLLDANIDIAVISGNKSESVTKRFQKFNLKHLYQGIDDKEIVFQSIIKETGLSLENIAYLGDDLIDLPVMKLVGLPCAVADADEFVKQNSLWISNFNGGCGAARELCELILSSKGLLDEIQKKYLG